METGVTTKKVFICHPQRNNSYEAAKVYGELVPILDIFIDFSNMGKVISYILSVLKDAGPDDYLLISGVSLVNVIAACTVISVHGHVNMLNWHGDENNNGIYTHEVLRQDNLLELYTLLTRKS